VKNVVRPSVHLERSKGEEAWGEKVEGIIKKGKIRFWNILIPIVQKGKKFVTFALIYTYGTNMVVQKEGVYRDGTIDEKVTVISSVVTYIRTYVHTKPSWKLEMGSVLIFVLLKLVMR